MDNIMNEADLNTFLGDISLNIESGILSKIVDTLERKSNTSLYDLYTYGTRRDGTKRKPVCGKGTVYKIKKLYETGKLEPYLQYRENVSQKNKEKVNNTYLVKNKSESSERYTGKYSEEWKHYERIKEVIIALQYVRVNERGNLLDQIEKERVTLDDKELQERLSTFIAAVEESAGFNLNVDSSVVDRIISDTSRCMNKRYRRLK